MRAADEAALAVARVAVGEVRRLAIDADCAGLLLPFENAIVGDVAPQQIPPVAEVDGPFRPAAAREQPLHAGELEPIFLKARVERDDGGIWIARGLLPAVGEGVGRGGHGLPPSSGGSIRAKLGALRNPANLFANDYRLACLTRGSTISQRFLATQLASAGNMASTVGNVLRLMRAGIVLAQHGVRFVPAGSPVPVSLQLARAATLPIRALTWPFRLRQRKERRVAAALTSLGPSYIKLGQFLATRADLIGAELAHDLGHLQDRLAPFAMPEVRKAIEAALGGRLEDHYADFGCPVAAASIAQVHRAVAIDGGAPRDVAVKILRPGIERRFRRDLESYFFAARQIERWHSPSRRLRPVAVVETLARSVEIEMDMRLEAAAISEMGDNIAADQTLPDGRFRVPGVDWRRTSKRVLTLEWIDGIAISDRAALKAAGHDLKT